MIGILYWTHFSFKTHVCIDNLMILKWNDKIRIKHNYYFVKECILFTCFIKYWIYVQRILFYQYILIYVSICNILKIINTLYLSQSFFSLGLEISVLQTQGVKILHLHIFSRHMTTLLPYYIVFYVLCDEQWIANPKINSDAKPETLICSYSYTNYF